MPSARRAAFAVLGMQDVEDGEVEAGGEFLESDFSEPEDALDGGMG
jgi:hypothetical protein